MTDNLTTEFILGGTDDDIKAMLKVARSSFEKSGSEYSFQLGHIKDLDIDDLSSIIHRIIDNRALHRMTTVPLQLYSFHLADEAL